jgi:hypothetical protein
VSKICPHLSVTSCINYVFFFSNDSHDSEGRYITLYRVTINDSFGHNLPALIVEGAADGTV